MSTNRRITTIIAMIIMVIIGVAAGAAVTINIDSGEVTTELKTETIVTDTNAEVEYAEGEVPAQIDQAILETDAGDIVVDDVPTVEMVDGGVLTECPEESEECAKGAVLPPIDISSPQAFYASMAGQCVDFDGAHGSQCYDLFAYFHYVYTGQWLSTNGTGAAYGIWDARDYNNPINPETGETYYVLVTEPTQLTVGAFSVFSGGLYGHVGAAMGDYNNGYISLFGTNQGGRACAGGGSAANIINMSLANFRGAFIPRIWLQPDPEPLPVSNCVQWHVANGDTMSKIMLECENTVIYGEAMDAYAKTWYSMVVKPGQSVYEGWISPSGVGLYAGDDIEHKTGEANND